MCFYPQNATDLLIKDRSPFFVTVLRYLRTSHRAPILPNPPNLTEAAARQPTTPAPLSFTVTLHFLRVRERVCVCLRPSGDYRTTMAFAGMLSDEDIKAAVQACQSESGSTRTLTCTG